jgi:hypothetical protein
VAPRKQDIDKQPVSARDWRAQAAVRGELVEVLASAVFSLIIEGRALTRQGSGTRGNSGSRR